MTSGPWDRRGPPPSGGPSSPASGSGAAASTPPRAAPDPIRRTETEGRPRRRLFTFWRVVTLLALGLLGWALWLVGAGDDPSGPHVARYDVTGIITVDDARDALLRAIADDPDAAALILAVDSPGGTATGAEALYSAVRDVAARKPVVALLGEVAASGGYIAAMAADRIVTRGNTLTGSIGVITQRPDLRGLLESLGVEIVETRSGPFKARPSPFEATPPEVEAWQEALIADGYAWFRALVGERRALSGEALDRVADGRVFTGRQALDLGLVDEIGGPPEARDWLTAEGIAPDLPVIARRVPEDEPLLARLLGVRGADALAALARLAADAGPRLYAVLD